MRTLKAIGALAVALVSLGGGCGGDGGDGASTPQEAVETYFRAIGEADGETACGLLTEEALAGSALAGVPASGADCVSAVDGLTPGQQPEVRTEPLEQTATTATVKVSVGPAGQQGAPFAVRLLSEGDSWKIDSLAISATQP